MYEYFSWACEMGRDFYIDIKEHMGMPKNKYTLSLNKWTLYIVNHNFTKLKYNFAADPRVDKWLMMDTPAYPFTIVGLYLIVIVTLGPRYMRSRPAFNIKTSLVLYNSLALGLNFIMGTVVSKLLHLPKFYKSLQQ
jgi:hypothetical protein